jgi:glycosyltransferase involved in cell wall biosynthesis
MQQSQPDGHSQSADTIPKVSIGLPVHNGARFLREAVDSILSQSFADFELIICDNDSDDGTSEIAMGYAEEDSRVRYYRNDQNIGAVRNFNKAFTLARGPYFKWAACDDIHLPECLNRCVQVLDDDPKVVLVYPKSSEMDEDGTQRTPLLCPYELNLPRAYQRFHRLLWKPPGYPHMCFGLVRASALARTKLLPNKRWGDYALLAELALLGPWNQIDEVLFINRYVVSRWTRTQRFLDPSLPDKIGTSRLPLYSGQMRAVWDSRLPAPHKVLAAMDAVVCLVVDLGRRRLRAGYLMSRRAAGATLAPFRRALTRLP